MPTGAQKSFNLRYFEIAFLAHFYMRIIIILCFDKMGFNSTKYIYALYIKSNEKYINDLQKGKKYVERRQNCERNALIKYKSSIYRLHR